MSNVWKDPDGLEVRFGLARTTVTNGGVTLPVEKVFVFNITDATTLGTTDATAPDGDAAFIPAGAVIKDAYFVVGTAFTSGGSAVLDLGLKQADGTVIDEDGIDANVAVTAIDADDDVVVCDGALIGTRLAANAYPAASYDTAAFTAGAGTLVIKYFQV